MVSGWGTEKGCNVPEETDAKSHISACSALVALFLPLQGRVYGHCGTSPSLPSISTVFYTGSPSQGCKRTLGWADNGKQRGWTRAVSHSCCAGRKSETPQLISQISPSNSFQATKVMESSSPWLSLTQAAESHWRQREKDRADRALPSPTHWHESQGGPALRLEVETSWLH